MPETDTTASTPFSRPDGRAIDQLRPIRFETGIAPHASAPCWSASATPA